MYNRLWKKQFRGIFQKWIALVHMEKFDILVLLLKINGFYWECPYFDPTESQKINVTM